MSGCCGPTNPARDPEPDGGYSRIFSPRFSRSVSRRYERRGLTATERRMVGFLEASLPRGLGQATVLEVGGGAGEIQLELLKRGAASTTNLELSGAYEADAARLIARAGVAARVRRTVGVDLAETPDAVEPADVVILHRVVCCYPDYERLLGAAADHARRALVFSYPPRNPLTRWWVAMGNALLALGAGSFRAFVHPPEAMVDVVRRHGLQPVYRRRGAGWCIAGAVRPS
ncbi:class I SAM-dependent methyltransferase [Sinomonas flava]|uniref:Methyltransferase domain-containing protein n=1 Tax=Sinomonas flava TaxID=496857 RepID=A0ABP5NV38_9MICC